MEPEQPDRISIGLFEAVGRCSACDSPSRERFELPTRDKVGARNAATWPCACGAEIEGLAECVAMRSAPA